MWIQLPARSDVPSSVEERRAALARLLAWSGTHGARWDGIDFRIDANGGAFGVATRALEAGESILSLPRRLMIVDDELGESTTGAVSLGFEPDPRDSLAAWLPLEARDPASAWRAYLDALPVYLAGFPMFRGADDLAALAGTAAHALASDTNRDVLHVYERFPAELRERLSLADFAWGRAIVMSRAFHAPGTLEHRIALLPIVDIFNHRRDDTSWSYNPFDGLVVRTERAIADGDEVCFSYGDRSNSHLLVHYGFTLPENTANEADLVFDAPMATPLRVRIADVVDHRFARALSVARLAACEPAMREEFLASLTEPSTIPFLGAAIEERALDVLAEVALRGRATLDENSSASSNREWEETCALVRDGERAILDTIIELAGAARAYASYVDAARVRAAAAAISASATGAPRMLRGYLEELAEALDTTAW